VAVVFWCFVYVLFLPMQLAVPVAAKLAATPGVAVGSLKCGCKDAWAHQGVGDNMEAKT